MESARVLLAQVERDIAATLLAGTINGGALSDLAAHAVQLRTVQLGRLSADLESAVNTTPDARMGLLVRCLAHIRLLQTRLSPLSAPAWANREQQGQLLVPVATAPDIESLLKDLYSTDWQVRAVTVPRLAAYGDAAVPGLQRIMAGCGAAIRREAIRCLAQIKSDAALRLLIEALRDDGNERDLIAAILPFGARAIPLLRARVSEWLTQPWLAVKLLWLLGDTQTLATLDIPAQPPPSADKPKKGLKHIAQVAKAAVLLGEAQTSETPDVKEPKETAAQRQARQELDALAAYKTLASSDIDTLKTMLAWPLPVTVQFLINVRLYEAGQASLAALTMLLDNADKDEAAWLCRVAWGTEVERDLRRHYAGQKYEEGRTGASAILVALSDPAMAMQTAKAMGSRSRSIAWQQTVQAGSAATLAYLLEHSTSSAMYNLDIIIECGDPQIVAPLMHMVDSAQYSYNQEKVERAIAACGLAALPPLRAACEPGAMKGKKDKAVALERVRAITKAVCRRVDSPEARALHDIVDELAGTPPLIKR